MFDKIFRDKQGKIVVIQVPNWPTYGWLIARIAMRFIESGQAKDALNYISAGFITVWAVMEISSGVNYFRRLLGAAVLVLTLFGLLR